MKIGKWDLPDECPKNCPFTDDIINYGQNAACVRCPVFNCKKVPGPDDGEPFSLIEPEEYRHDWAKVWYEWFRDGMNGFPELKFKLTEEEDE